MSAPSECVSICSSLVKKTGLPCKYKAKLDGKCGVHSRTKKVVDALVGPIKICCATVKKTGLPCKNKAKLGGKCGVHSRTKKQKPLMIEQVSDTETEICRIADDLTSQVLQQAIACC